MIGFDEKIEKLKAKLKEEGYWLDVMSDRSIMINTPSDYSFKFRDYPQEHEKREKEFENIKKDIFCSSSAKGTYQNHLEEVEKFGNILKECGYDPNKEYKMKALELTLSQKRPRVTSFDYNYEANACWLNVEAPDGSFHRLWGVKTLKTNSVNILEEVKTMEIGPNMETSLLTADEFNSLGPGELKFDTDFLKENWDTYKKAEQVTDAICPDNEETRDLELTLEE